MSKGILKTFRIPMSKKHQVQIGKAMQESCGGVFDRAAILCQPRVFAPHFGAVWQAKPEWQIAILSPELYEKINALLVEAHTGQKQQEVLP